MSSIDNLWARGAVADGSAVVGIDLAVTIHVTILHVARINGGEGLRNGHLAGFDYTIAVGIVGGLEEAVSNVTEGLGIRMTRGGSVGVGLRCLSLLLDLVLVHVVGTAYIDSPVAEALAVIEHHLEAVAFNLAHIFIGSSQTENRGIASAGGAPDVITVLEIVVEAEVESLEESRIETDVVLQGLLASEALSLGLCDIGIAELGTAAGVVERIGRRTEGVELLVVGPYVIAWQYIELLETCTGAELQEVNPSDVLHEGFVADIPRQGSCRHECPLAAIGQTVRSTINEGDLSGVALVINIVGQE